MIRSIGKIVIAVTLLFVWLPVVDAGDIKIVDKAKLDAYWNLEVGGKPRELAMIEIDGRMKQGPVGCINVGFVIDSNGSPTRLRLLKVAIDPQGKHHQDETMLASIMSQSLSDFHYRPTKDNVQKQEVFTTYPIVYLDAKWAVKLDAAQKLRLNSLMLATCEITDLASWVAEHGVREAVIVPAPSAEQIAAALGDGK